MKLKNTESQSVSFSGEFNFVSPEYLPRQRRKWVYGTLGK